MKTEKNGSKIYRYVVEQTGKLKSYLSTRKEKYRRNYMLYEDTAGINLDDPRSSPTIGYRRGTNQRGTTPDMSYNVIKSCIDTMQSMVEERGVRPFLNLKKGQYRDVRIVRIAQHYFDFEFERISLAKIISSCFKDSAIFDTGFLWVDGKEIKNILPWQVYIDPAEEQYGKITKLYYERKTYPSTFVTDFKPSTDRVTIGEYWDTNEQIHVRFYETGEMFSEKWTLPIPFLKFNFSDPILGGHCNSIADQLMSTQFEINFLLNAVKDASQKTPVNTILLPKGAYIGAKKLSNGAGNILEYDAARMTSTPTVATPAFSDPEYMKTFEELKQNAYEMTGVSQLASASLKPAGIDSGKGLQTLEDIQAGRFESIFRSIVRLYVDLTELYVALQDPEEMILPDDSFRCNGSWGDLQNVYSRMKVQYCSTDSVSKDPAAKSQLIQLYIQSGLVPQEMISQLLEIPDLDTTYSYMSNHWSAVQTVIDRCIFNDDFEIPPFVSYLAVAKEILNVQLLLFTADPEKNLETINKLSKLFSICYESNERMAAMMNPQQPEEPVDGQA